MAAMLPASMDEDRVGAMAAAMLSLGDRTAQELARGHLEQVLIKGQSISMTSRQTLLRDRYLQSDSDKPPASTK